MRRFLVQVTLLACFVVLLASSGAYASDENNVVDDVTGDRDRTVAEDREKRDVPGQEEQVKVNPCSGGIATLGKILCVEAANCVSVENFITCVCREGDTGDGWVLGSGCSNSNSLERQKRADLDYIPGLWVNKLYTTKGAQSGPCTGVFRIIEPIVCVKEAKCRNDRSWFKCVCPSGMSGDGFRKAFGSGCS